MAFLFCSFQKIFEIIYMKKEEEKPSLQVGRFYRFRPTMLEANIIGPYLVDLEGLNIQFFHLKDFSLAKRVPLLSKEDQYCAQIIVLNKKFLVIFGIDKFTLFNIETMQTSEIVKINTYIEKLQVRNNFIAILSSDEDSQNKIINCWKIEPNSGKVQQKFKCTQFMLVDYEECSEDNMCMSLILSIEGNPKVYVYWKNTVYMIQVDPRNQTSEKYNRHSKVSLSMDLSKETYAEIIDKSIVVNNKKSGKKIAQLMSEGQEFTKLFSDGSLDKIYSLSNFGLKKWKLQSNSAPTLYTESDKFHLSKIFFTEDQQIIGLDLESNTVVVWKNEEQYLINNFPHETIRKAIKLNDHQIFFLLQATASSSEENEYQVSKYNKLQIYDFNVDNDVAKKAMLKAEHSVDIESIVINDGDTIRFIVDEKGKEGEVDKKYILRWTPFSKDENQKDTKKKEIKGTNSLSIVRLYPFNRILGITHCKKPESFSLFTKETEQKTQIVLFDYSAKKIGDYDLQGQLKNVEISEKNLVYTIGHNRISIYSIAAQHKNRLQKVNELDISALSVTPINDFLLIKKEASFLLLDSDFECLMKEETKADDTNYKVIPVSGSKFLLKTEKSLQLWDTERETSQTIEAPECQPNIMEYMNGKLVIADRWVQVYDFKLP